MSASGRLVKPGELSGALPPVWPPFRPGPRRGTGATVSLFVVRVRRSRRRRANLVRDAQSTRLADDHDQDLVTGVRRLGESTWQCRQTVNSRKARPRRRPRPRPGRERSNRTKATSEPLSTRDRDRQTTLPRTNTAERDDRQNHKIAGKECLQKPDRSDTVDKDGVDQ